MSDPLDGYVHSVNVSAFYMAKNLTTKAEWDTVRTWALSHGYPDIAVGEGKGTNHPVVTVSWFDVVKWCNARSEQEGLTPCYEVGGEVMRNGTTEPTVKWMANGYRLPTEAEWEKSARGGLIGKRFPWGDTITHSQANYYSDAGFGYDISPTRGLHPTYAVAPQPYTSPVGSFAPNGYGLNDMAGNVWQWCWDWYGPYDTGTPTDPRGTTSGLIRVFRGGAWNYDAPFCRVAYRFDYVPAYAGSIVGFRVARSSVP
jgi:formylglycine-generating enzyme required for sulfatase activity